MSTTLMEMLPLVHFFYRCQLGNIIIHWYSILVRLVVCLVIHTLHFPHLLPFPRVYIQDPGILQGILIIIQSTSDQQLWVLIIVVQATCCM